MNESEMINFAGDNQSWIDRLVDGELDEKQRRQLLAALEAHPDAWRRCALSFIEAQNWRDEFRQLTQAETATGLVSDSEKTSVLAPRTKRRGSAAFNTHWLAIGASVIVAFTLGIAARGWIGPLSSTPPNQFAADTPKSAVPAEKSISTLGENVVATENSTDVATTSNTAQSKYQALKVTIPTDDGEGERTVEVPLVATGNKDAQSLLAADQPALSDSELQTLESTGHEVEQHRAYYPVQLADGTQAVLPMDLVEVRDTGNWQ